MEAAEREPIKKDQETQTPKLATLYIEPGSFHDKLLGENRQQLVDFVRNPSKIYTNVLLKIGRPPMQDTKSYIDLLTRTLEDPPVKEHFEFDPHTWEFYQAGLDYNSSYSTNY
jgi:hypothetical protein